MAILAGDIVTRASILLKDPGFARWTKPELYEWISDAQRKIVLMAPNSNNTIKILPLAKGTRQKLPDDAWLLLDVLRAFYDSAGTKPGNAIRVTSRQLLDAYMPTWHQTLPTVLPYHFTFDTQDQTAFFVYPPNTGTGFVEVNYAPDPIDVTSDTSTLDINDIYEVALLDYTMFRACSKDAEYSPGLQAAAGYLASFTATMAEKDRAESSNDPNQAYAQFDPEKQGTSL